MLPSSHQTHIQGHPPAIAGGDLAEAFSDFISASARLELSYRELQGEVAELTQALAERNQALSRSLSENRSMGQTLERIIEAMPCGVMVVNADGEVQLANPEAARLVSVSGGLGRMPEKLHCAMGLEPGSASYQIAGETEQEFSFEGSSGTHWIAMRKVPLGGVEPLAGVPWPGRGPQVVVMLRDISAQKRMEQEREAARDSVALAQVAALLAHEIRNPLASLELFAGLIEEGPERAEEWISHLRAGIRSLSGTVNNVLTLHGGAPIALERVNVAEEAELSVSFLQPMARQAGVDLRLQVERDEIWCRTNKSAFQQILLNLCSNALRHTSAGGLVRVVCSLAASADSRARIAVIDTGCGIAQQHLARLFEAGFSGSGVTPGLGLAVCERLVRQQGGALHVTSRLGYGSTFTLELSQA